jgi:hypothetical protein
VKGLILALLPLGGLLVGYLLASWSARRKPPLDKRERQELERFRSTEQDLIIKASEHAMLGDDFAVIALSIITKNRSNP